MAIFHLSVKTFSRSKAQSAVAAAAYRAGERLEDARLGEVADYSPRRGVLREHALLCLPPGAPAWTREKLWNAAEEAEKRKNSTVAREVEIALPAELEREDAIALAHDFARWLSETYGIAADAQIHEPLDESDARNLHCHILMTTRTLGPEGLGQKTRVLDDQKTGPEQVEMMRKEWAERVNSALEFRGFDARVDHRSHARRGLAELPTIHEGRQASAASRAEYNEQVRALNAADEQLRELLTERAQAVAVQAIEDAARQAAEISKVAAEASAVQQTASPSPSTSAQPIELKAPQKPAEPAPMMEQPEARLRRLTAEAASLKDELSKVLKMRDLVKTARDQADEYQAKTQRLAQLQKDLKDNKKQRDALPFWRPFAQQKLERQAMEMARLIAELIAWLFGWNGPSWPGTHANPAAAPGSAAALQREARELTMRLPTELQFEAMKTAYNELEREKKQMAEQLAREAEELRRPEVKRAAAALTPTHTAGRGQRPGPPKPQPGGYR